MSESRIWLRPGADELSLGSESAPVLRPEGPDTSGPILFDLLGGGSASASGGGALEAQAPAVPVPVVPSVEPSPFEFATLTPPRRRVRFLLPVEAKKGSRRRFGLPVEAELKHPLRIVGRMSVTMRFDREVQFGLPVAVNVVGERMLAEDDELLLLM